MGRKQKDADICSHHCGLPGEASTKFDQSSRTLQLPLPTFECQLVSVKLSVKIVPSYEK